jgi:hypothetical protein
MSDGTWRPVVIIGAPRSGTNLLRDLVCQAPGFGTWPCDEINLLWRHGNASYRDDALPPERATKDVTRHMRRRFADIARATGAATVVEKTCANSLRVAFVDRILPDARYLFIVRDGRDAVASAIGRFSAPVDWRYTLRKLRYVPASDVPLYALQFARNRATRLARRDRRLAAWGPRFAGFAEFARSASVPEICARQWRECVELAARDLAAIGPARVLQLRYEALVRRPRETLAELFGFLGAAAAADAVDVAHVSPAGIGRGRAPLEADGGRAIPLIAPALARFGYV